MEFLNLLKERFSCRQYLDYPVQEEHLKFVLEAGRLAPSACNFQPWYFIVVQEPANLKRLKTCYAKSWLESAPLVLVICGDHRQSWKRDDGKDHCDVDVAIAIDHMTLAASSQGLASCWICKFDALACAKMLDLPDHIEPIALIPLGYPALKPDTERHKKLRKALTDLVMQERWNGTSN